jgi:hypothetical protein
MKANILSTSLGCANTKHREYTPRPKKKEESVEELQTGRKYLFPVGRTKKLFGSSPSELLNGCIRAEGGGPKVFPTF